mgnify:CR=1 FL=1
MHRLSPADELAEIRAEIARLKLREAQLRDRLVKSPLATLIGRFHRVEISHDNTRIFDPALLPDPIRNDPAYWRERSQTIVRTLPLAPKVAPPRPGWPIRRAPAFASLPAH